MKSIRVKGTNMSHTIKSRFTAIVALIAAAATVAAVTPADASANARWSDGSFSEVFFECRTHGIGASNVVVTHKAWGSGSFVFKFWIRSYPNGQWVESGFLGLGSYNSPQAFGQRWQFYVQLWHLPVGGVWHSVGEYGYVIQNSFHQGYGAACAT